MGHALKTDILEILLVLAEGPLHGYGIVQRVRANTGGEVELAPSLLYRRLKGLEDSGLVADDGLHPGGRGKAQRRYRLTAEGLDVLRSECQQLLKLTTSSRLQRVIVGAPEDAGA